MLARKNGRILLWMGFAVVAMLILAGPGASGALAGYSTKVASPPVQGKGQAVRPNKSIAAPAGQQAKLAPPAAPYITLYDQYDNPGTQASTSQDFEPVNDGFDNQAADDFIVPGGQTWDVNEVDVNGLINNGPGPVPAFNIYFYTDAAGFPGTLVASRLNASALPGPTTGSYLVPITTVSLASGTYWMSAQARMDFATGGQWYWFDRTVTSNAVAKWQNPGDGFGTGCTAWGVRVTCLASPAGEDDQEWRIVGNIQGQATSTPTATPSPTFTPCPGQIQTFTGTINASDLSQTDRMGRNGVVSTCAVPKVCPGALGGVSTINYDLYTLVNPSGSPVCYTVSLDSTSCGGNNLFTVAYLTSYNPAAFCTNYLADPGSSFAGVGSYSFTVPAGATFVIWVGEISTGLGCASYTLTVDGFPCGPTPTRTLTPSGPTFTPTLTPTVTPTSTIVNSCAPIVGSITATDGLQAGRMTRNAVASTCASPKTYPGTNDGAGRRYDAYNFTNSFGVTQCITVNLTSACSVGNNLFSAAYLGTYNQNSISTNYLADAGSSISPTASYSFNVPPGGNFTVVVHEVTAGSGCSSYTLDVQGHNPVCPTNTPTATSSPTITRTPTRTPTCPPVLRAVGIGNPGKPGVGLHVPDVSTQKVSSGPSAPSTAKPVAGKAPTNFDNAPMDFIIDDYVHENSIGFGTTTTETASIWLNRFTPPGGSYPITLNNIFVAWPAQSTPALTAQLIGKTVRLLVYSDVDGDGNPANAVLVGSPITVTIAQTSTANVLATFQTYPVSVNVTGPTGDIYIGWEDYWAEPNGFTPKLFPAAIDTSPPSQHRSWIAAGSTANSNIPNITNLADNATRGVIDDLNPALAGNWMIRANATSSLADPCPATNTPLPTSTFTPTHTPTPAVTPALAVQVQWQGITPPSQSNTTQTLNVTLRSTSGGTLYSFSGNTDANGVLTVGVGSLPNDTYNIRTKGPRNLANCSTVVLTGGLVTNKNMGVQLAGDANDSNNTNSTDFTILKNSFGKSVGQVGYDARADFNNNDVVNSTDFNLLKGTFGQQGCNPILRP